MNMLTLVKASLSMLLDRWNGSTVRLMTDPKLLEVPKELKPLMDMIESGLVYMHSIRIPNDNDLKQYPHVFFTSPDTWDASVLDHGITPSLLEEINQECDNSLLQDSIFDEFGELQHRMVQQLNIFWDSNSAESGEHTFHTYLHESNTAEQEWKSLRPYFGWQSEQVIQDTYKVTSRFGGTIPHHDCLKNISNQETQFSISPGEMSLLPQIPSLVTHLL